MNKSIAGEYKHYCDMVYPEGMPAKQAREIRQAFYAGALSCSLVVQDGFKEVKDIPLCFAQTTLEIHNAIERFIKEGDAANN